MSRVPNPFRRATPNTKARWGYSYEETPQHMTVEQMKALRYTYDKTADDCLECLYELQAKSTFTSNPAATPADLLADADEKSDARPEQSSVPGDEKKTETTGKDTAHQRPDLFVLLRDHHSEDARLDKVWQEVNTVPEWVDWDQIARGQEVFYRYGGANLTGLAFASLLGGMGAGRVVETLTRTGGFNTKAALRRLYETTQHILQVTKDIDSVKPGGKGWENSVRVRLLHSAMRMRILKLEKEQPGYFNVEELGIPANDLDSIATIASFSSSLIWISLPRQGLFLTHREAEDYIALWRYVAYLFGTPTDPFFTTVEDAKRTFDVMFYYEIEPTETGRILAYNLIAALSYAPPVHASPHMLLATARWLNGHELCDALHLPRPDWAPYYYALLVGQCCFFMWMCYTTRLSKSWDKRKQELSRLAMWKLIVTSDSGLKGKESTFTFKWIPRLGKLTARDGPEVTSNPFLNEVERRNLSWFFAFVLVLAMCVWLFLRI